VYICAVYTVYISIWCPWYIQSIPLQSVHSKYGVRYGLYSFSLNVDIASESDNVRMYSVYIDYTSIEYTVYSLHPLHSVSLNAELVLRVSSIEGGVDA